MSNQQPVKRPEPFRYHGILVYETAVTSEYMDQCDRDIKTLGSRIADLEQGLKMKDDCLDGKRRDIKTLREAAIKIIAEFVPLKHKVAAHAALQGKEPS